MKRIIAVLLIAIIGASFFWQSFVSEKILLNGDALNFFYPLKQMQANAFREFRLPLWNQFLQSGTPLLANSQAAALYPANFLILFLQTQDAIQLMLALNVIVAGITMFFFAKRTGLNESAAIVSAIAFMASGQMISRIFAGHLTLDATYSLIPLVFLAVENAFRKKKPSSFALLGIAMALQFFAGFMQLFYYTMLFAIAFAAFHFFYVNEKKISKFQLAKGIAVTAMVFLALTAIQLFPSLELAGKMNRSQGLSTQDEGSFSMPIATLVETLLPNAFGNSANHTFWGEIYYWEFTPFIGTAAFLLAAIGIIYYRKNKIALFFFTVTIASLLLALGKNTPLFAATKPLLSALGMFRAPARMLAFYCLGTAMLAGFGAQSLIEAKEKQRAWMLQALGTFAFLFLAISAFLFIENSFFVEQAKQFIEQKFALDGAERIIYLESRIPEALALLQKDSVVAGIAIAALAIAAFIAQKKSMLKKAEALVAITVFFELLFFSQIFLRPQTDNNAFEKNPLIASLESKQENFRVVSKSGVLPQHLAVKYGIEMADGYDPTILKNYAEFASLVEKNNPFFSEIFFRLDSNTKQKILGIANVKYILRDNSIEENAFVLPRAFVAGKAKAVENGFALQEMSGTIFDPKKIVLLEDAQSIDLGSAAFFNPAVVVQNSPEKIMIDAEAQDNGFLFFSVPYYPGWKASIDGVETKVFKADHAFMAIALQKGMHSVVFSFEPESVKVGLLVSAISIVLLCVFFVQDYFRKRKK